jgi:hypothetical protein
MDTALAPGFARITYNGVTGIHHALFTINLETGWVAGTEPNILTKGGSSVLAETAIGNLMLVWLPFLHTSQQAGLCEIYAVDATTGEGTFVYGFDLAEVGSNAGTPVAMGGATLTLKLVNGRTHKSVWLDTPAPVNQKDYAPFSSGGIVEDYASWAVSPSSILYGRGNAYPFAAISFTTKTFDPLREREGLA